MSIALAFSLALGFFTILLKIITNAVLLDTLFTFAFMIAITTQYELNSLVCFLISLTAALIIAAVLKFVRYIRTAVLIGFAVFWGYMAYTIAYKSELPLEWSIFIGAAVFLYHFIIGMAFTAEESVDPVGGLFSQIKSFFVRNNKFEEPECLQNENNPSDTQAEIKLTACSNKVAGSRVKELLLNSLKDNEELRVTYDKDGIAEFEIVTKSSRN